MNDHPRYGVRPYKARRRRPEPARLLSVHEAQAHFGRAKLMPRKPRRGVDDYRDHSPWRAGLIPENDYQATADTVYDNPRQPSIVPTGVLDSRGQMLCRVSMPIKVKMGFHNPGSRDEPDELEVIVPEDMLRLSDCGAGISHLDPDDFEDEDEDEEAYDAE